MKKVIILAVLTLVGQTSWADNQKVIRDFQTTRLISTAGAGVASILSTEAAVLNPAASTFFEGSSFSYQSYKTSLDNENALRDNPANKFPSDNSNQGIFLADHSGPVKGGVAYLQQDENNFQRERMVLHGASAMGPNASLGVSYNFVQDVLPKQYKNRRQTHHMATIGTTHIIDEDTILGLVVLDPTRTIPGSERAIGGFQYNIADRFMVIGDFGVQYTEAVSEKYQWSAAVQLNVFSDFFFRAGQFYDNIRQFKGTGWGASWIGPRFGVEFAQKFSEQFGEDSYIYEEEKLVDTSLSAILKF